MLVPDGARGELIAVTDHIILIGFDGERILRLKRFEATLWHRKRVVGKIDLLVFLAPFVKREVDDPAKAECVFFNEIKLLTRARARGTRQLGGLLFLARSKEATIVGTKANGVVQRLHPFVAMILGNGAAKFASLAGDVTQASMAFAACPFVHVVKEFAALFRCLWRRDSADNAAAFDDAFKQAEARFCEMAGHVMNDKRVAQIGLVCAVIQHRFCMGNTRELASWRDGFAISKFFKDTSHYWLHRVPNLFLRDKAHFQIELVKFARQTVSTWVFITEAWCDLEIAVKASDHQQLLILLRRLWQREEFAGVNAAWHEEIARAFRAGCRQDGR